MNISLKNIVRVIVLLPLTIYFIYCSYYTITEPFNPKYQDCGVIVSRSTDEIIIKYGTKTELYLNIQFDNSGFKSIKCEPTLYFSKKVGDRICTTLNKETSNWHEITMFVGIAVLSSLLIIAFIFLIFYLVD